MTNKCCKWSEPYRRLWAFGENIRFQPRARRALRAAGQAEPRVDPNRLGMLRSAGAARRGAVTGQLSAHGAYVFVHVRWWWGGARDGTHRPGAWNGIGSEVFEPNPGGLVASNPASPNQPEWRTGSRC